MKNVQTIQERLEAGGIPAGYLDRFMGYRQLPDGRWVPWTLRYAIELITNPK